MYVCMYVCRQDRSTRQCFVRVHVICTYTDQETPLHTYIPTYPPTCNDYHQILSVIAAAVVVVYDLLLLPPRSASCMLVCMYVKTGPQHIGRPTDIHTYSSSAVDIPTYLPT